jgi:hypothetical protein
LGDILEDENDMKALQLSLVPMKEQALLKRMSIQKSSFLVRSTAFWNRHLMKAQAMPLL